MLKKTYGVITWFDLWYVFSNDLRFTPLSYNIFINDHSIVKMSGWLLDIIVPQSWLSTLLNLAVILKWYCYWTNMFLKTSHSAHHSTYLIPKRIHKLILIKACSSSSLGYTKNNLNLSWFETNDFNRILNVVVGATLKVIVFFVSNTT